LFLEAEGEFMYRYKEKQNKRKTPSGSLVVEWKAFHFLFRRVPFVLFFPLFFPVVLFLAFLGFFVFRAADAYPDPRTQ